MRWRVSGVAAAVRRRHLHERQGGTHGGSSPPPKGAAAAGWGGWSGVPSKEAGGQAMWQHRLLSRRCTMECNGGHSCGGARPCTHGNLFSAPKMKGWLLKQGGAIKTWKRRWCVRQHCAAHLLLRTLLLLLLLLLTDSIASFLLFAFFVSTAGACLRKAVSFTSRSRFHGAHRLLPDGECAPARYVWCVSWQTGQAEVSLLTAARLESST